MAHLRAPHCRCTARPCCHNASAIQLLAPDLIHAEVGNVIWKKRIFQGVSDADAHAMLNVFRGLSIVVTPTSDLIDEAYRLAVKYKRTVYDSLYIALSNRENCRFVTADEKLVNAVTADFPNVIWLPNWP